MKRITDILDNKKMLYIFSCCILIFIPLLKQISFYMVKYSIINNYDSVNTAIILFISLPFLIIIYLRDLIPKKRKLDFYDYLLYVLIFAGIISTIFSINKGIAIFGKYYRHEGFLSILTYYFLFINWKINGTKADIKRMLKLIVIIAIVNSGYALLQIYTRSSLILRYTNDKSMASGLCGNPNFFGSLIITAIGIITAKYFINKGNNKKELSVIVLLFISLINCQSTGPFLTYVLIVILLIIYLLRCKKLELKRVLILLVTLVITYGLVWTLNVTVFHNKRCEMCDLQETVDNGGNGRLAIWKKSLSISRNHLITGVGYDNLYLEYNKHPLSNPITFVSQDGQIKAIPVVRLIVDNAHNVYLHTLVSTGLLGFIPYLILCLYTFIHGLKRKDSLSIVLLSGFVAYSIQAFANISVISVAPIYYIIMGFILSIKE